MIIEGASGGNKAQVNEDNQLLVSATSRPIRQQKALNEEAYIVYANKVIYTAAGNPVTGTGEADLLYLVNNDLESRNLVITSFDMFVSPSTGGGSSYSLLNFYKNPTAGPSTVPGILSNSDFNSAETVTLDLFQGDGTTKAMAGTPISLPFSQEVKPDYSFIADTVIPKNKSIGFTITPPVLNTSMIVTFLISFFLEPKV